MRSFDMKWVAGLASWLAALLFFSPSAAWAHWPDQAPHQIANLGEFRFEGGGMIPNLKMSYVTHGKLNAAKDNAILFMHGFGLNHHQIDHLIGPGQPLDTDKYFIICTDAAGQHADHVRALDQPDQQRAEDGVPAVQRTGQGQGGVPAGNACAGDSPPAGRDRNLVGGRSIPFSLP